MPTDFYSTVITADPRFNSIATVRDILLLEPVTRTAVQAIMTDAKIIYGIDLRLSETYRSQALQEYDFKTHHTQLPKVGLHHYGLAADFFKMVDGRPSWLGDWSFLSKLARKHGLIAGFDWGHPEQPHSFRDQDHVQRIRVEDQTKLFNGFRHPDKFPIWYPDENYNPYSTVTSPQQITVTSPAKIIPANPPTSSPANPPANPIKEETA